MKLHLTASAALAVLATALVAPTAHAAGPVVVRPGHSIQAALDHARPGATVAVRAGTYRQSLTVTKPVHLVADGRVRLLPPATAPDNLCTEDPDSDGAFPGICVVGTVADPTEEGSPVATPVRNVEIRGFRLSGFSAASVEAYGARHLRISHVTATANPGGAVFVSHSAGIRIDHLTAAHNGSRGVDLHERINGFSVTHSRLLGNHGEGLYVGDSQHGRIATSLFRGNCVGMLVLDEALPGDHGVSDLRITGNRVLANNRFCAGDDEGAPAMSGNGIVLAGVRHATVTHNRIRHQHGRSDAIGFGGLALIDAGPLTGGSAPHHVRVVHNAIRGNTPANVTYDHSGSANVLRHNR